MELLLKFYDEVNRVINGEGYSIEEFRRHHSKKCFLK